MREGWVTKRLGDVCTLQRGFDLPKKQREEGGVPLISSSGEIDSHIEAKVKAPGVATGRSGSIGNVFFIEKDFWPLNTVLYVKDFHGNDERFVYHLLKNFDLNKYASGAGVPTLNRNNVHDVLVNVPVSREEQQRIVAILDEAIAGIATATANAEKNLQNARELFESTLQSVFAEKGEGWETKEIGECFKIKSGDFLPKKQMNTDGEYEVYGGNGQTGFHDQYNLNGQNVVIGRVGAKCGNVHSVNKAIWLTDNAFYVSEKYVDFDNEFLALMLEHANLGSTANQAAQPVISYKTIKPVMLSFPSSVVEQQGIVERIHALNAETTKLEEIYQTKLNQLAELKQSILQKAFAGELH